MRKKNATLHDLIWMLNDYPYIRQAKSLREIVRYKPIYQ